MTEQEKIPSFTEALTLFLGGDKVEMKEQGADNWYKMTGDCLNSSVFDLMNCDYRKKPEKKTRLMTAEELKGKWLRGWNDDGHLYQVTSIDPHDVFLSGWSNRLEDCWINIQDLVSDEFKLEDGSPLTVEVD